jgi:hypothetical protein
LTENLIACEAELIFMELVGYIICIARMETLLRSVYGELYLWKVIQVQALPIIFQKM